MLQQNPNKNIQDKDLSKSTSSLFEKFQIKGGRFEKRLFVLLIIFVVIAIPLTFWQFNRHLKDPFVFKESNSNSNSNSSLADNQTGTSVPILENLRELDTDQDGLNDYDELYRYKTSPYIQDSDSDKILDNIEVEQGTDPNCPEGNTCSRVTNEPGDNNNNTNTTLTNTDNSLTNLSVDQLRQIMIDAGAPEEDVYKIPAEDLQATYQQILATENISTNTSPDPNILNLNLETPSTGSIYDGLTYEKLLNLSPTEIRQLLIEGGVPGNELSAVDDATLQEIYLESLKQNFSQTNQ